MADSPAHTGVKENIESRVYESSPLLLRPAPMETHTVRNHARRQFVVIYVCALATVFVEMGCFFTSAP